MKRITWKKHHKWFGLIFCFFMLMFGGSGIILNHRRAVADYQVSRSLLPDDYLYSNWNRGLLRGTCPYVTSDSARHVLIYGGSGIWLTDSTGCIVMDFNAGLPAGADYRNIRTVASLPDGSLWAVGQFGLYRYDEADNCWRPCPLSLGEDEKLSDLTFHEDTLIAVGRSYLYISSAPYTTFQKVQLAASSDYDGRVSLFRLVWLLHSGELFGLGGKLAVDAVAVIFIILCVTGVIYWLLPKHIRRKKRTGGNPRLSLQVLKHSLNLHDRFGRYTFVLLLLVAFTGWCLRPPLLIALVYGRAPIVPYTSLDDSNPWQDKLRMLRYDEACGDWLLSTSEGIYSLSSLDAVPQPLPQTPPVSVMGLNVWQKDTAGRWLMGSFSGLYVWDRRQGASYDYFTGEPALETAGPPFGKYAVSGYSADFSGAPFTVEYYRGTDKLPMPRQLSSLPMSLWNVAQEIHTGRIYTCLGQGTLLFIFFAGAGALWCLLSGFVVRRPKR